MCTLARRRLHLPKTQGLHGYNTFPAVPYDDPAFRVTQQALFPDALRYPGGTVANYFDWRTGSFVTPCSAKVCSERGRLESLPERSFASDAFARGASSLEQVWVLNVLSSDAAGMRMQLEWLASQRADVAAIEFGNELFASRYAGSFPTAHAFMTKVAGAVSLARRLFPFAKLAAPMGFPFCGQAESVFDTWNRDLARYAHVWDALTLHDYSTCAHSLSAGTADPRAALLAWGDAALRKHRAAVARAFGNADALRLELWLSEVGVAIWNGPPLGEADAEQWNRKALAGMHMASFIVAAAAGDSRTRRLHLHLMAAEKGGWGSKAALVHIQRNASTVTSARLSAAGQVVSHVAAIAQRGSGGSVGIEGIACPQMQHAVLGVGGLPCVSGAAWLDNRDAQQEVSTWPAAVVLINRCPQPIKASLVGLASADGWGGSVGNITVYMSSDVGDRVR